MRKSDLIRHLDQLELDDLRQEVLSLYDSVKGVKDYYAMELGSEKERQKLYDKAKKDIVSKFATKSRRKPRRPRIQKLNLLLNKLDKSSVFPHEMIDIYLFACEQAINFKIDYRFKSDPLDNTITGTFQKAIDLITAQGLIQDYNDRCSRLFEDIHYYDHLTKALTPVLRSMFIKTQ
jgi:hypothetical protein